MTTTTKEARPGTRYCQDVRIVGGKSRCQVKEADARRASAASRGGLIHPGQTRVEVAPDA